MPIDDDAIRRWDPPPGDDAPPDAGDAVVVLPLGATEQHGPHLPISTDVDIGHGLLAAAFRRLGPGFPAWALPMERVGASLEHHRFEGTTSVPADHLADTICRRGRQVARHGVRRLVVSNSHGGNQAAVETAALRLRAECDLLVVKASYYRFDRPADIDLPDPEWRHGLHGGAVETAMMLHLRPERVKTGQVARFGSIAEELEASRSRVLPTGAAAFAWLAGDLNRAGAVGDATLATAEIGRRLVAHYAGVLADVIRDARRFPIERLGR